MSGTLSSDVGTAIALATVYALPLLALQPVTEKGLRRQADALRFPLDWIIYGGSRLALGVLSAAIGSSMASLLGIVRKLAELFSMMMRPSPSGW